MTVIVLIRRVAKKEKLKEFLEKYQKDSPIGKIGFITEYLTKVENSNNPVLNELDLTHPSKEGIAFLNVAFWESEELFLKAFNPTSGFFDDDTECEPRKRAVLKLENMAGPLPPAASG